VSLGQKPNPKRKHFNMEMSLEKLIKTPVKDPCNQFTKFAGEFPIDNLESPTRNNAQLAVWKNDDGFFVIPTKIGGIQYSLQKASQIAIENTDSNYPEFNNMDDAMVWAYNKNNCVNEDGTVS
jgi:hypothetical protein